MGKLQLKKGSCPLFSDIVDIIGDQIFKTKLFLAIYLHVAFITREQGL